MVAAILTPFSAYSEFGHAALMRAAGQRGSCGWDKVALLATTVLRQETAPDPKQLFFNDTRK
jgi:hypothetical protein